MPTLTDGLLVAAEARRHADNIAAMAEAVVEGRQFTILGPMPETDTTHRLLAKFLFRHGITWDMWTGIQQ